MQNQLRNNNNSNQLRNNPGIRQVLQMKNQIQMAQNPQLAFNNMLMNNPQISNVVQLIKQNGGDAKTAFFNYAQQLGVNPQDVINLLNS